MKNLLHDTVGARLSVSYIHCLPTVPMHFWQIPTCRACLGRLRDEARNTTLTSRVPYQYYLSDSYY